MKTLQNPIEQNQRGSALIAVIVFTMILGLLGAAFFTLAELEFNLVELDKRQLQAGHIAESGLQYVKRLVESGEINPFDPGFDHDDYDDLWHMDIEDGSIDIEWVEDEGNVYRYVQGTKVLVQSKGTVTRGGQETEVIFEGYIGLPGSLGHDCSVASVNGFVRKGYVGTHRNFNYEETDGGSAWMDKTSTSVRNVISDPYEDPLETDNSDRFFSKSAVMPKELDFTDMDRFKQYFPGNFIAGNMIYSATNVPGADIIMVDGNINIEKVNIEKDWPSHTDVTFVATGDITVNGDVSPYVQTDYTARLNLIAKNDIKLEGNRNYTVINGIALAGRDIVFTGSGSISSESDASRFFGTIVAGRYVQFDDGWLVSDSTNVINGCMVNLADIAIDDFEPDINHWHKKNDIAFEHYTINPAEPGYNAVMGSKALKITINRDSDSSYYPGNVYMDFDESGSIGLQDWNTYAALGGKLSFWLKADDMEDSGSNPYLKLNINQRNNSSEGNAHIDLSNANTGYSDGSGWARIEIPLTSFTLEDNFDWDDIKSFNFYCIDDPPIFQTRDFFIDNIQISGSQNLRNYGLPSGIRYEITNKREISEIVEAIPYEIPQGAGESGASGCFIFTAGFFFQADN